VIFHDLSPTTISTSGTGLICPLRTCNETSIGDAPGDTQSSIKRAVSVDGQRACFTSVAVRGPPYRLTRTGRRSWNNCYSCGVSTAVPTSDADAATSTIRVAALVHRIVRRSISLVSKS
jgi:hypothetical protein